MTLSIGTPVVYRALHAHLRETEVHAETGHVIHHDHPEKVAEHRAERLKAHEAAETTPPKTRIHHGSVHHRELRVFAGQVTRVHENGHYDVIIFPPNGTHAHVDAVKEGTGNHEIQMAGPLAWLQTLETRVRALEEKLEKSGKAA